MVKDASKGKTQKLIIPRGTIDSADTTIIEIPMKLHGQPVVVAKKKLSEKSINLDGTGYSFNAGNRDGISFASPHQTILPPDMFADFNEKSMLHSTMRIEDKGAQSSSTHRADYPSDMYQRPLFPSNDRYAVPPSRPYGSTPGDIQRPFPSRLDRRPFPNDYFPSGPQPSEISDVEEIEQAEKQVILEELQKYHEARRRFLEDASAIATKSKMRVSRQGERPESYSRNFESPQRDATGSCKRKSSTVISCPHCTFDSQTSSAESFGGCREVPKYSSSCQTEVPVKKVYPTRPTVNHKSSVDCRTCCSLTEKSSASDNQRKRTSMFSAQDLCEIATQFREARKKLDKVIAQATQPAKCASGVSLAPCQKHNRNQSPDSRTDLHDSRSCSNNSTKSNPRELDPLLVSRHLRTEAGGRPVEKKISAHEEKRNEVNHEITRPRKHEVGTTSSGLVRPSTSQTQSESSKSSKKVDTADSYGDFMKALWKNDLLKSDKLNNSPSVEQTPNGSGTRPSSSHLNSKTVEADFTPTSVGGISTLPVETITNVSVPRPSKGSVPVKPVGNDPFSSRFEPSTTIDEDVDRSGRKKNEKSFIPVSKIATKSSCGPQTSKSICKTCCDSVNDGQDIRSVPSIMQSQELMKIRQQFQEATRRLQQALASLPSSGICGSKSGTFPCQKYR